MLDDDHRTSAKYLADMHVWRQGMVLSLVLTNAAAHAGAEGCPINAAWAGSTLVQWVLSSSEAWEWMVDHCRATVVERRFRFMKVYPSERLMWWALDNAPTGLAPLEPGSTLEIPQLTHNRCKIPGDPVSTYRAQYHKAELEMARRMVLAKMAGLRCGQMPTGLLGRLGWDRPERPRPSWMPEFVPPTDPTPEQRHAVMVHAPAERMPWRAYIKKYKSILVACMNDPESYGPTDLSGHP